MIIYQGTTTPDLTQVPYQQEQSDWNITNNQSKAYIKNKPTIPTKTSDLTNDSGYTTFDGDYNSLSNKPALFSGSYNDLTNKPTIPTVNNGTLTIMQNGSSLGTFSANQSGNVTVTIADEGSSLNAVTLTQAEYDALTEIDPEVLYLITDNITWNEISNKPNFATVATSGSYNDLTNKPSIPTVGNRTIAITVNNVLIDSFTTNEAGSTAKILDIPMPTKTSDLTNDSGYITGFTETDPVFNASPAKNITNADITNWNNKGTSNFSGNYNDLTNKPSIPTVNNGTITITQGGTTKGSFTTNQSTNQTIDLDAGGGGGSSLNLVTLTQAEYDALTTKDPNTLYCVTDKGSVETWSFVLANAATVTKKVFVFD